MRTKIRATLAACSLSTTAWAALAAGPLYQVTCLDCGFGKPLKPLAINAAGVVVATNAYTCYFPGGCTDGQGFVIAGGSITATPSFDAAQLGSTVQALNDAGSVVGRAALSTYPQGPFGYTYDGSAMVDIGDGINDFGDGYFSSATGINALGHVVGTASGGYHETDAYLYKDGVMSRIPLPKASYVNIDTPIVRINARDHVVGTSFTEADDLHQAWVNRRGKTLVLAPDSTRSEAYAINDKDQIVGFVRMGQYPAYNDWPVIWSDAGTTLLNTLAGHADGGQANAINNHGWVVGTACGTSGCTPFVYNGATMYDLNQRLAGTNGDWTLVEATGINDAGTIVGIGRFGDEVHAFQAARVSR